MKNLYLDHLETLLSVKPTSESAISIFVPLNAESLRPAQIFRSLQDAANRLLVKDGKEPVKIDVPIWSCWDPSEVSTVGIFHYNDSTTVIPLPTSMQPRVVVASSFHLKPLLAALDEMTDGLHLHFDENGASLYKIDALSSQLLCRFKPSVRSLKANWAIDMPIEKFRDHIKTISREIEKSIFTSTKILVVSGMVPRESILSSKMSKLVIPTEIIEHDMSLASARTHIRLRLSHELNSKRMDFIIGILERSNHKEVPIQELGKKILESEINQLCISLEDLHFGVLNTDTGRTSLNKLQLSSRDDDLLDDLAEMAIKKGVKVSVVPKRFLPIGKTYLAS